MQKSATIKAKGGKLLKVAVLSKDGIIEEVRITGDFFVYPEEGLILLEESLRGASAKEVDPILRDTVRMKVITLLGFKLEELINMVEGCV